MRAVAPHWYHEVAPGASEAGADGPTVARSQERLSRELAAFLEDLARSQPLVLFLDDLHWADASSVDFLAFLAPRLAASRILVVATYRESDLRLGHHPFVPLNRDLQARRISRVQHLDYLSADATAEYIGIEFPEHRFPQAFLDLVHGRTGGSPLFLVDLLRYLGEEGALLRMRGTWELVRPLAEVEGSLPASTRNMIQRKTDQLDDEGRRLLVTASVQGHEFDSAAVAAALGGDPADVEARLTDLEAVHAFVRRLDERELPDGTLTVRYRFAHVLYQNVLHASLTPSRRTALSAGVARSLMRLHAGRTEEIAPQLAVLFEAARDAGSAAAQFAVAAQNAARVFANREAEGYARRGLAVCSRMPATPERAALEIGLQLQLGFARRYQHGYADTEAWQCAARARALCQELGDSPALSPALVGVFMHALIGADLHAAHDVALRLEEIAVRRGDPDDELLASTCMATTLFHLGELRRAHAHFERVIARHDPRRSAEYRVRWGLDPGVNMRALSSQGLWLMGRPQEAANRAREALAVAQAAQEPGSLAFALVFMAFERQAAGDAAETLAWADACLAHCAEHGLSQEAQWVLPARGWALAQLGRGEEGIAELRACLDAHRAVSARLEVPYFLGLLADALLHLGRAAEAQEALREGLGVVDETRQRFYAAELHRLRGVAQLALAGARATPADRAAAAASFQTARALARQIGATYLAERAERSLTESPDAAGNGR
jgi:tetratricopeptide (TPR) repeat protein